MKKNLFRIALLCVLLTWLVCGCACAQIDIQETLLDESQFAARISIMPDEEPVYIILDHLTIGGVPFEQTGGDPDMWAGYPQSVQHDSLTYEFYVLLEEGYVHPSVEDRASAFSALLTKMEQSSETEVSFRITLLAPKQSIQAVDITFTGDSTDTWRQIDEIAARGDTPVDSEQPYTTLVSSDCWDGFRADEPVGFPLGSVDALVKYANMEIVEQETFEFFLK